MVVIIPISKQTENFQQGKSIWILASSKIYILGLKNCKIHEKQLFHQTSVVKFNFESAIPLNSPLKSPTLSNGQINKTILKKHTSNEILSNLERLIFFWNWLCFTKLILISISGLTLFHWRIKTRKCHLFFKRHFYKIIKSR